jgi:hypothetical protein
MHWHAIAIGYLLYLTVVSMARPEFARVRGRLAAAAAVVSLVVAADALYSPAPAILAIVLPPLVLLAGYRLSGLLFVRIDFDVEARLLASDDRLLGRAGILRWYRSAPRLVSEYFELCYLLVYATLPAGATVLAFSGHAADVERYWTVVVLATSVCFGVLPWLQTRPPMLLEDRDRPAGRPGPIRRLNQMIAARGSIRACTIPSGHAAGSMAAALVIVSVMPAAGTVFVALALSIAVASVLGRYHYAMDSFLGLLVALTIWMAV